MEFASHQLLARAALTNDERGTGYRSHTDDHFLELRQRGTGPDERRFEAEPAAQQGDLLGQAPPLDRVLDLLRHALHRLRLVDETVGAEPDGLRAAVIVAGAGVDDDRHAQPE